MAKPAKIDDVKRPDKVTPSATARPILVTNHPTLATDPMMASSGDEKQEGNEAAPEEAPTMNHTKAIEPLGPVEETPTEAESPELPKSPEASKPTETPPPEVTAPTSSVESTPTTVETPTIDTEQSPKDDDQTDAAVSAEEVAVAEAKAKRDQELESLIASGKYAVPINAVQRRRSRVNTMALCVLAVALALILVDAVADVGIVNLPTSVPHTHFFSKN